MDHERIENIVEQLYSRTAWGVCDDVTELIKAKIQAEQLIELIDNALEDIHEFADTFMPENTAPHPPEEEAE